MAYATEADIVPLRMTQEDLIELTSDTGVADDAVVQAALDEASSVVDSYCSQRYTTPLQASGLVKKITVDLAVFDLASRRRDTQPSDTWTQRRMQAMSFLADVANGKASLDQPATAAGPQMSSADATVTQIEQRFSDCNLGGFV